jgi:hypothetical protein
MPRDPAAEIAQCFVRIADALRSVSRDDHGMSDARHEPESPKAEAERLLRVAEKGESEETPAIAIGGVWIVTGLIVLIVLALAMVAYWLA